jgi:RES domain
MSSRTWTLDELKSNSRSLEGICWRVVEAQSNASTMKLTDTLEEQIALERLIEAVKPSIPPECAHLAFLLFTPFRYVPYPFDSRFRRAGSLDGVFYASELPEVAIAEKAFYRLLFFLESPGTPWPSNPGEYMAFAAQFATGAVVDLTQAPWLAARWTHRTDYSACLDLADDCRVAAIGAIRYESVRDPLARANIALLTCRLFARNDIVGIQTWRLHFSQSGVRALCEFPYQALAFDRGAFARDARIQDMRWDR